MASQAATPASNHATLSVPPDALLGRTAHNNLKRGFIPRARGATEPRGCRPLPAGLGSANRGCGRPEPALQLSSIGQTTMTSADPAAMTSHQRSNRTKKVRCYIVGGGPAGMMLGYLLGRAGIEAVVLEKHADFFRDFRGDTVHPSTLQVMDELGLVDGILELPHQRLQKMDGLFGGTPVRIADLSRLRTRYPFIAFMPQWDFLNFLREAGQRFASLKVMMSTEAG